MRALSFLERPPPLQTLTDPSWTPVRYSPPHRYERWPLVVTTPAARRICESVVVVVVAGNVGSDTTINNNNDVAADVGKKPKISRAPLSLDPG